MPKDTQLRGSRVTTKAQAWPMPKPVFSSQPTCLGSCNLRESHRDQDTMGRPSTSSASGKVMSWGPLGTPGHQSPHEEATDHTNTAVLAWKPSHVSADLAGSTWRKHQGSR